MFQYQLHGASPSPFHAFNLFLHAVNSGLVFWILNLARPGRRRLVTTSQLSTRAGIEGSDPDPAVGYSTWIPFVGGLVFALHPIQTEAVLYVYQRSTLLATLFGFLTLIAHLKGQSVRVLLYFVLGVASKEFVIVLPVILWIADGFLGQEWRLSLWHRLYLAMGLMAAVSYLFILQGNDPTSNFEIQGTFVYAATQLEVLWQYLLLTLIPLNLNLDHHIVARTNWFDPRWWGALLLWPVLILGVLRLVAVSRSTAFYVVLFFMFLLPTSSLVPRQDYMFEHRVYASMLGFSAFLAWCLLFLTAYFETKWGSFKARKALRCVVALSVFGLLAVYVGLGKIRGEAWSDEELLWRDTVLKSPAKYRPNYNLGVLLMSRSPQEAEAFLSQAIDIDPSNPLALRSLGEVYFDRGEVTKAKSIWKRALDLDPGHSGTHAALGQLYLEERDFFASREHLRIAQRLEPSDWRSYYYLARLNLLFGYIRESITGCEKGLNRNPKNVKLRFLLADSVSQNRNWPRAIELYLEGLVTDPKNVMVYYRLARAYWELGKREEAFNAIQQGMQLSRTKVEAAVGNELLDRYRKQSTD